MASLAANGAQLELSWNPVPGALGYTLYRRGSTCSSPMAADHVVSLPAEPTTFVDTGLQPETSYYYTVRAVLSAEGCETVDSACATGTTTAFVPAPVSDGAAGAPVLAARTDAAGTVIDLTWDVGCPAAGYHLLFGSLSGVSDPTLTAAGGACNMGLSGSYEWLDVPAGDLWFLVISDDGATVEGSWGQQSNGVERGSTNASGQCGMTTHDNSGSCL